MSGNLIPAASARTEPAPRRLRGPDSALRRLWGLGVLAAACAGEPADLPGSSPLADGGFESPDALAAWGTWIYQDGQPPLVRLDSLEPKEGRQCLLVSADEPADVALGQVVSLPPASVWRASCWIRTENLKARERTDVGGSLHVQTPDGPTLARGTSAFGTTGWRPVDGTFRVPPDGRAKVVLFYIGYGKGTGKAWFDGVRLERLDLGAQIVRIARKPLSRHPVDPKQGGQFIEPLCNLIPSLVAQQVANTSFEAEPPWNVAFRRDVDKPHRPWFPDGAVHLAQYSYDTNRPGNGSRSLRLELKTAGARAGISQDGFWLEAGRTYRLRLLWRGTGGIPGRAWLHGAGATCAGPVDLGRAGLEWRAEEVRLPARRSIDQATLTIDAEGPGTLWLDRVSLIGDDAVLGLWRPDAVKALRELRPAAIRFGGSAMEGYEWDRCLGPWDRRAPFLQAFWGGLEENFVGLEEFVQLCREVEAEPLICVRWTGRTPADAAAEVEYFNGGPETPGGRKRAQNGHPRPYAVKYWQLGNEVGGAQYDASVRAFAQAMRRADPAVKVLSSFPSADLLSVSEGQLDYLCPHHYGCADLEGMERDFLELERQVARFGGARPVRIAVTEWNTTAGDWELGRCALQTLDNALRCARYHNLMHRHADSVEIAIRSNLIDSFGSGVIQTGPGWMYLAPTYYAQQLYARAAGGFPLRLEWRAGTGPSPLPWSLEEPDLSAVLSPDGRTLRLYGVNPTTRALRVTMELAGFAEGVRRATARVLKDSAGSPTAEVLNSRDEPRRIRVFESQASLRGTRFAPTFEPLSLTLFECELGR